MKKSDAAWAAGIIEGEGWIGTMWYRDKTHGSKGCVSVVMTDRDVLRRLYLLFKAGSFRERRAQQRHWKRQWIWRVYRQEAVVSVLQTIYPWLGKRRRAAATQVLKLIASKDKRRRAKPRRRKSNV